jgi:hypothetical protein
MSIKDIANQLKATVVWLRRIGHCRGFGIQSPSDYWLVRYVINEHWPYYQYESIGQDDDWLTRKQGRLCFRIANWRQPAVIESNAYREYLQAGCRKAVWGESSELMVLSLEGDWRSRLSYIYNKVSADSVLVVTGLSKARDVWREIVNDERAVLTFDLYYCGIVLFDKKRDKKNYIVNF